MKNYIHKAWVFLMISSKDPQKVSLTVKAAALGVIPYIMQAVGIACTIGFQCINVDATTLELIAHSVADGIYYGLTLMSVIGIAYGAIRKTILTVKGEHKGLGAIEE